MAIATGDQFGDTVVTDASGNATLNFAALGLANPPVVNAQVQDAGSSFMFVRITALSNTSVTINVRSLSAVAVALIGLTVLATPGPAAGVTVHITGLAA